MKTDYDEVPDPPKQYRPGRPEPVPEQLRWMFAAVMCVAVLLVIWGVVAVVKMTGGAP